MHLYVRPNRGHPTLSAAAGIVAKALSRPWQGSHQEVRLNTPTCHYLLFFDGGSKGQPGPRGIGCGCCSADARRRPFPTRVGGHDVIRSAFHHQQRGRKPWFTRRADGMPAPWLLPTARSRRQCHDHSAALPTEATEGSSPPPALLALPTPTGRRTTPFVAASSSRLEQDGRSSCQYGDGLTNKHANSTRPGDAGQATVAPSRWTRRRRYRPLASSQHGHGLYGRPCCCTLGRGGGPDSRLLGCCRCTAVGWFRDTYRTDIGSR